MSATNGEDAGFSESASSRADATDVLLAAGYAAIIPGLYSAVLATGT